MRKILPPNYSRRIITLLFVLAAATLVVDAERLTADEQELPTKGRLAGTSVGGNGAIGFEGVWGGSNLSGESSAPISASIVRNKDKDWRVIVNNNSEDEYRVQIRVQQMSDASKTVKSTPLSISLKPTESYERVVRAHVMASHAVVDLSNWSKKTKSLSAAEINQKIAEKQAEIQSLQQQLATAE